MPGDPAVAQQGDVLYDVQTGVLRLSRMKSALPDRERSQQRGVGEDRGELTFYGGSLYADTAGRERYYDARPCVRVSFDDRRDDLAVW